MNDIIKIVIADDLTLFREALVDVLSADPSIQVIGQGTTAFEAYSLVKNLMPDILVLDLGMPGGGLKVARKLHQESPDTKVIILTASDAEDDFVSATKAGVCAYMLKGVSGREFIQKVHEVWKNNCPK